MQNLQGREVNLGKREGRNLLEGNFLGLFGLLSENWLGLSSKTFLFSVVSSLTYTTLSENTRARMDNPLPHSKGGEEKVSGKNEVWAITLDAGGVLSFLVGGNLEGAVLGAFLAVSLEDFWEVNLRKNVKLVHPR